MVGEIDRVKYSMIDRMEQSNEIIRRVGYNAMSITTWLPYSAKFD